MAALGKASRRDVSKKYIGASALRFCLPSSRCKGKGKNYLGNFVSFCLSLLSCVPSSTMDSTIFNVGWSLKQPFHPGKKQTSRENKTQKRRQKKERKTREMPYSYYVPVYIHEFHDTSATSFLCQTFRRKISHAGGEVASEKNIYIWG